jgi:hypothetical protein
MYRYDSGYYDHMNRGSMASARSCLPRILESLHVSGVADFGCGQGAWLRVWDELGIKDYVGLDGDYVDQASLLIDPRHFRPSDLNQKIELGRRFDAVQCLEVAEHLAPDSAEVLIDSLVAHSDVVIFSAAVPGQGGEHHINERPLSYWCGLFNQRGFDAYDLVRPGVKDDAAVKPWYRYNLLVYVKQGSTAAQGLQTAPVSAAAIRTEYAPMYRARLAVLRWLPIPAVTFLAQVNKLVAIAVRGRQAQA